MTPQEAHNNVQTLLNGAIANGMFKDSKSVLEMQQSVDILTALIPKQPENTKP